MKIVFNRLYSDYLMPSRMARHEQLVELAAQAGYTQPSVRDFYRSLRNGSGPDEKVLLHRHDIDTDLRTARKLFELERRQGIHSTFYFRLSTLDLKLMHEIEEYGSEASYHYEELSTFAKKHHLKDAEQVRLRLPEIRAGFMANFRMLERRLGNKLATVASHGDFANRRLKLPNTEILTDGHLRERCGIECEAYDRALLDCFDIYIADREPPVYYHPSSPFDAIGRYKKICLLTHPRQFESSWRDNTRENLIRAYESLAW